MYLPFYALVLGFVVRVLKSDSKLPINVAPENRMRLAYALGLIIGVIELVINGSTWQESFMIAVVSPTLAVFGHEFGIEWARNGREIHVPFFTKKT
jgi:hypothetical protein